MHDTLMKYAHKLNNSAHLQVHFLFQIENKWIDRHPVFKHYVL